jgi:hypothetical protein
MMLTGGLMMVWAALLFLGIPLAIVAGVAALWLRRTPASGKGPEGARDESRK